ncbi:hypothetical protein Tco_0310997, partial [Tanacetum coccineum]
MYKFKINPVNGPHGWKKSDVPTTIIPQKPHPQIGRPPKKRKTSAAELADEIMRGCKSKKGGGSQQASVAGHGDAAHGSQQAVVNAVCWLIVMNVLLMHISLLPILLGVVNANQLHI